MSVPNPTLLGWIVAAKDTLPVPSKLIVEATTSPVNSNVLDVANLVAVEATPVKSALIVPALKLPDPLRETIVLAVLASVAFDATVNVTTPELL